MSSLPFTDQQCFFVAILVFIIVGFQRGWRRELITLVFVLLAVILIRPNAVSGRTIGELFARIPTVLGYLLTGSTRTAAAPAAATTNFLGPWGTLIGFIVVVALGYIIGNRVFPKPANPAERFIGIVPAIISGAFILGYLTTNNFFAKNQQGQSFFSVVVQPPDPSNYVPVIFVIAVIAVVVGLIAARTKKSAPPAGKK
ncbi:MAG: hypothetical protein NVS4B11_07320 [Ktedonobacteraceae bacterium]